VSVNQDMAVKLTISEPLDACQVLRGRVVRPIKSLEEESLYYLFQDEHGGWWVIKPRYEGDQLEAAYLGKQVQVAIASITDRNVVDSNFFGSNQVSYFGIGSITVSED